MSLDKAPSSAHVIWAIARRELGIAWRRKLVKMLFILSLLPPLGVGIALVVRMMAKEAVGFDLEWDPVTWLFRFQTGPVALIALGLGTPSVARDRAEEVLYLYAVRPVSPWHYTAGKMVAVAVPTMMLLVIPSIVLAILRDSILGDLVGPSESFLLVLKATLAAIVMGVGFAGVCVGPSAATRRGRWALLIALAVFGFPEPFKIIYGLDGIAMFPTSATADLQQALFDGNNVLLGFTGGAVLLVYGVLGALLTRARVATEMTP
ncbi:MAG: hypothetical protein HKN21_02970 [Candidatus Eisenbacteria bacterium]|uniref:Uncharacterized protein n=1 Tax=Eiseniibacteriota bacterium TaxID=2212470 RepID=A0A7Y2E7D1_UNCEI|nr:hypothetical protein [Candidatus Eisenbacteria bacterium]